MIKKAAFFCFLFFWGPWLANAQKLSPKWYGRAETKTRSSYNSYLCEMVISKKANQVSGTLSYFFGKQEHLVKISGVYWPQTRTIELNPFKLITHFATDENSPDCLVDGSLTLYTDGGDSVLYGQLNPVGKYRNMCPILTISLNKEEDIHPGPDPDFPIPPDVNPGPNDSLEAEMIKPFLELATREPVRDSTQPAAAARLLPLSPGEPSNVPPVKVNRQEINGVKPAFLKRSFTEGPLILVDTDTVILHLYDNGQVDNDSVTVFFNRVLLAQNQKLSLSPIVLKIVLAPGENEIAMFAENLGDIPPNTALCLVYSGDKRYEINLMSNLTSNGIIRIKRRTHGP